MRVISCHINVSYAAHDYISSHLISSILFQIQKLMREVEELHQMCAVIASNRNSQILEHERQMTALQSELEENFGLQLVQIKEKLR